MTQAKEILFGYLLLTAFLAGTIFTSFLNVGIYKDILAFGFALGKAIVILLIFMRFRKFNDKEKIAFLVGLFTLLILIIGVLDDVIFRTI